VANESENAPIGEDKRVDSLEDRIASARHAEDARQAKERVPMADGRSAGVQIAATMVGYPLGGFVVGFALDQLFGTLPWIAIALMMLAFVGACVHVIRLSKNSAL
jgi:ATP synthase protein I